MSRVEPIRRRVVVPCAPERAFDVFTAGFGTWWPADSYSRAVAEFADQDVRTERLEFRGGIGGRILEHLTNGATLPWAEVLAWDPPRRLVLAWRPHPFPEPPTELEVTFAAADGGTAVEVDHGGWERVSEGFREQMYDVYVRGWVETLERYGEAAASSAR